MSPRPPTMDRLLRAAATRLAQRRAVRGASRGAWIGLALAATTVPLRLVGWLSPTQAAALAVGVPLAAAVAGAAAGWLRRGLNERELALVVDRSLGTEEAVVTAMHELQAGRAAPNLGAVVDALGTRAGEVAARLPVRPPPSARWAAPAWATLLALALFTPPMLAPWLRATTGPTEPTTAEAEGERLAARMAELVEREQGAQLPEELQRDVVDLASDLQGDTLTPEETMERLESIEQQLERFQGELAGSDKLLEELEEAAKQLDAQATEALGEALSQGDMEQAAQAASDLAESLSQSTPEEQRQAAEALQQAGESLQQSSEPGMQQTGKAMEQLGQKLEQQAQAGSQQGSQSAGEQGEQGEGSGPSKEDIEALQQALQQQRDLGERLERDRERLAQAQQMQGAIEGAQERMESEAGAGAGGEEGEEGEQGGQQVAAAQGASPGGRGAGDGHTWEDEGEYDAAAEFQDGASAEASKDPVDSEHIDDFEKFYAPVRVDDAQALLATAEGQLDESGRIDTLVTRLTESDETAQRPTLELPAEYREAATEAIEAERIPPAYRDAVKSYFD